jgi:hypothetical protein
LMLLDLSLALLTEYTITAALQTFLNAHVPGYARLLGVFTLFFFGALLTAPLVKRVENSAYWRLYETLCRELYRARNEMLGIKARIEAMPRVGKRNSMNGFVS